HWNGHRSIDRRCHSHHGSVCRARYASSCDRGGELTQFARSLFRVTSALHATRTAASASPGRTIVSCVMRRRTILAGLILLIGSAALFLIGGKRSTNPLPPDLV